MHKRNDTLTKRVTIHDVAKYAKVSKTSVSRYLGESRNLLSEQLVKRIATAIDHLQFQPDRLASSLRGRRTRLIGMIIEDITNPYTAQIIQAVEDACQQRGYALMVCNTNGQESLERQHLETLRAYHIEGIIIHPLGNGSTLHDVIDHGMPVVLIDRTFANLDAYSVGLDNQQAIQLGLGHLEEQGFSRVLYVTKSVGGVSSREERATTFSSLSSRKDNMITGEVLEIEDEKSTQSRLNNALLALASSGEQSAVFCANAPIALYILETLKQLELDNTLGLLMIDEERWSPLIGHGISTLVQPTQKIGAMAMSMLCQHIAAPSNQITKHLYPAELHARYSTLVAGRLPGKSNH